MTTGSQFVEPGAKNERGEFKRWIHIKRECDSRAITVYPYPVDQPFIDADLIVSHWYMTRLENWPTWWAHFCRDLRAFKIHTNAELVWRLAYGIHDDSAGSDYQPVPKGVLDAFT